MIARAVRASLLRLRAQEGVVVALSGGRDSVVLLHALLAVAADRVRGAVHVHHGLSPNADAWSEFCATLCAARAVPLAIARVDVSRAARTGLEAEARRQRYAALAAAATERRGRVVALAHHRDDQAETLLLQLLRGAGPRGLAAMAELRDDPRGVVWWRPLLEVPRAEIDAYAREHALSWVDDESNASARFARNAIRRTVMPALASLRPDPGATLARAAAHQAESALLQDDLAALDAAGAFDGVSLSREALAALPAHRGRNLLRWFLRARGLPAPPAARLAAMLDQLAGARVDAMTCIAHGGLEIGVHRERIHVHPPSPGTYDVAWAMESALHLAHGRLEARPGSEFGIDPALLRGAAIRVRSRAGGERLQLAANRPRRALKSILQDADLPPWARAALPLVVCGDEVIAVPGIGVDARWQAPRGRAGLAVEWSPLARAAGARLTP